MNDFLTKLRLAKASLLHMELNAARIIAENQIKIFTDIMQNQNDRVIWTNMLTPTEILYPSGLIPIQTELISGWFSTLNLAPQYIEAAHTKFYNINVCSYHKAIIGALENRVILPPEIAVFSSHICDGGSMLARYLRERFGTKVFLLDIPYYKNKKSIHILENDLAELIKFLERHTGQSISYKSIKKSIVMSNMARQYLMAANNLRKKDALFNGYLGLRNMYGAFFLLGSELGMNAARIYCRELSERKPVRVKHRILWIHFAPLYAGDLFRYFEEKLNCMIAFDITGCVYWKNMDTRTPYKSLADKMLSHFYLGDTKERINFYMKIINEYKIDAVVMFMHQGCRSIPGASWEIKKISENIDIPFLELHGDCIDNNSFSFHQMKLRMEAFAEGLENRSKINVFGN